MSTAEIYLMARHVHVTVDAIFVAGLLGSAAYTTMLSFQTAEAIAARRRLVRGVRLWNRSVTGAALLLAFALGLWMATTAGWFGAHWLSVKLALVVGLSAIHGWIGRLLLRASDPEPVVPTRYVRLAVPLILFAAGWAACLALNKH